MGATSTSILSTGLDSMVSLFQSFLTFALSNWIPVVIAVAVVVGIIAWAIAKTLGLFQGRR